MDREGSLAISLSHRLGQHLGVRHAMPVEQAVLLGLDHRGHGADLAHRPLHAAHVHTITGVQPLTGVIARQDAPHHFPAPQAQGQGKAGRDGAEGDEDHVLQ